MARPSAPCNTATTGPRRRGAPLSPKVPVVIVARDARRTLGDAGSKLNRGINVGFAYRRYQDRPG